MSTNEENPGGFELATTDPELDSFLGLDEVTDINLLEAQPNLQIEMSPEQAAEIVARNEEGEGKADGEDEDPSLILDEAGLINHLLEAKGIKEGMVRIQNEDGTEEDIAFSELTSEEQLEILNTPNEEPQNFEEHELNTIEWLRKNEVTFEQAVEYFSKKAVEEALASSAASQSISEYTDEEIYTLDLISKYNDLSEEEIKIELDKQNEHPELFKKKVDALRQLYLQAEQDEITQAETENQRIAQEEFDLTANKLVTVAKEVEDIGGLDIELEDKQEVLGFILNKDVNGLSDFGKLLDDPKALFEIAWYAKKGKQAFETIHEYYKKEITEANRKGYEKGKAENKPAESSKPTNKAVIRPKAKQNITGQSNYMSVEELYKDL